MSKSAETTPVSQGLTPSAPTLAELNAESTDSGTFGGGASSQVLTPSAPSFEDLGVSVTDDGYLDLSSMGTEDQFKAANAISEAINNSQPDPNRTANYNALKLTAQEGKELPKVGSDFSLNIFAALAKAIKTSEKLDPNGKKSALAEATRLFDPFMNEKKSENYSYEFFQQASLQAMAAFLGSEDIQKDARDEIEQSVNAAIKNKYKAEGKDLSQTAQTAQAAQGEVPNPENDNTKPTPKKPDDKKEGDESGINVGNTVIQVLKASIVTGLAVGVPGIGWVMAIGFLVATRNWGVDKDKKKMPTEEEEELERLRGLEDMNRGLEYAASRNKARAALKTSGNGEEEKEKNSAPVSFQAATPSAPTASDPTIAASAAPSVDGSSAAPVAATHTGAAASIVAEKMIDDLVETNNALAATANKLSTAQEQNAGAREDLNDVDLDEEAELPDPKKEAQDAERAAQMEAIESGVLGVLSEMRTGGAAHADGVDNSPIGLKPVQVGGEGKSA